MFKIDLKGVENAIRKAEKSAKDIDDSGRKFIEKKAKDIAADAKGYCQSATVSSSITAGIQGNTAAVGAGNGIDMPALAAYLEFGTGNHAAIMVPSLPADWQEMARKYFISGRGRLPARPYLYPAFKKNIANIDKELNGIK